jgi:hypothetical protein
MICFCAGALRGDRTLLPVRMRIFRFGRALTEAAETSIAMVSTPAKSAGFTND